MDVPLCARSMFRAGRAIPLSSTLQARHLSFVCGLKYYGAADIASRRWRRPDKVLRFCSPRHRQQCALSEGYLLQFNVLGGLVDADGGAVTAASAPSPHSMRPRLRPALLRR